MNVSFTLPDDMIINGLHETKGGWMVYLRPRRGPDGWLHGDVGTTPQEAVDRCEKYIRDSMAKWRAQEVPAPTLNIKLDLSRFRK